MVAFFNPAGALELSQASIDHQPLGIRGMEVELARLQFEFGFALEPAILLRTGISSSPGTDRLRGNANTGFNV